MQRIMFPRIIILAFALTLIISSSTIAYANENRIGQNDVDICLKIAETVLEDYYYNVDLCCNNTIDKRYLTEDMFRYLDEKIELKRYVTYAASAKKENYVLSYKLLSYEVHERNIKLSILTEASYNYIGLDVQSGFGEVSDIVFIDTSEGYQIADWYINGDNYDAYVRGEFFEIDNLSLSLNTNSLDIADKQMKVAKNTILYFEKQIDDPEIMSPEDTSTLVPSPTATLYSLNKTAIKNYAINNAKKSSPSSGGSGVPYYDFSKISGSYDCTNFVSHALLAGGAVPYKTNNSGISSTGWYYVSLNNRSSSWSGVPDLHKFLVGNKVKGPVGRSVSYAFFDVRSGYAYDVGDILQCYSNAANRWRHSTIVTGYYVKEGTGYMMGALVTGRSSSGSYNYNQKADTIYAGQSKRVIKLSGCYK